MRGTILHYVTLPRTFRWRARFFVYGVLLVCIGVVWKLYLAPPPIVDWPKDTFGVSESGVDVYTVDRNRLRLYWKDAGGHDYGTCRALADDLKRQGVPLRLALNSGIFRRSSDGFRPLGLHVENHQELAPLNPATSGYGNFYLQPNGVFWWDDSEGGIESTQQYAAAKRNPAFAIQSGPMLVIGGEINPFFARFSQNRYLRAGIGVRANSEIVIAISETPVRLYDFAQVFKQRGCPSALYLDGAIVSLFVADSHVEISRGPMAGILAVVGD